MKIRLRILPIAAVLLATNAIAAEPPEPPHHVDAAASAPPAEPYDFRGAKLGMSLADFKQLPYPDGDRAQVAFGNDWAKIVQVHCSDESKLGYGLAVYGNGALEANHGLRCQWKHGEYTTPIKGLPHGFTQRADGVWMVVGSVTSKDVSYDFTPDSTGTLRLFQIQLTAKNDGFEQLALDLKTKFGPPSKVESDDLQNGIGNHFASAHLTWDNGLSTIELKQRYDDVETLQLTYAQTRLSDGFWKKAVAAKGPPKL